MTDNFSAPAASAQDVIGWQNFMEGKIAKEWGQLQDHHYVHLQSKCTVDRWTSGLVSQLLELMHGMWTHWNKTLHAVDDQGLPWVHSILLQTDIYAEFQKDVEDLAWRDYHFIWQGWDNVLSMSASKKQAWLHGICLAHVPISVPTVYTWQFQLMHDFFIIINNWSPGTLSKKTGIWHLRYSFFENANSQIPWPHRQNRDR
jgi:hypothetical protein